MHVLGTQLCSFTAKTQAQVAMDPSGCFVHAAVPVNAFELLLYQECLFGSRDQLLGSRGSMRPNFRFTI